MTLLMYKKYICEILTHYTHTFVPAFSGFRMLGTVCMNGVHWLDDVHYRFLCPRLTLQDGGGGLPSGKRCIIHITCVNTILLNIGVSGKKF